MVVSIGLPDVQYAVSFKVEVVAVCCPPGVDIGDLYCHGALHVYASLDEDARKLGREPNSFQSDAHVYPFLVAKGNGRRLGFSVADRCSSWEVLKVTSWSWRRSPVVGSRIVLTKHVL